MAELILPLIFTIIGTAILLKGADFLVSGSSSIAYSFKINPIVIGLTIVAFGTSAPELVVSVTSAMSGNTNVALGNIIGSNIANILLILGVSALLCPLKVQKNTIWKEIPMSFLGAIVITVLALQTIIDHGNILNISTKGTEIVGVITKSNGIILLAFFIIFLYYTFGIAKVNADTSPDIKKRSLLISILLVIAGLLGLVFGSKLLVDGAITIAKTFGVSDTLIGLTLVAVGTSLPELVTSIVAAYKKQVDIAVGNVIGSNIFNIFFVLGATALVRPLPLPAANIFDILVLFAATIILFISLFVRKKHVISKFEGSLMLLTYIIYLIYIVKRG